MFQVGAGLDSQILGDYEIVGQIKAATKFSKENGFMGSFSERLVNAVLQSSKNIKNNTLLSGGTVSVSFAAVQYIKKFVKQLRTKNILLIGVGKIGRNTCKNLVDYLETKHITIINRSPGKALKLATEMNLRAAPIEELDNEIRQADIILVATNSATPIITMQHLQDGGDKLIIDLSVPSNVENEARNLPNVHLVNVDELSRLKDETLKKREAEVPKANAIIREISGDFYNWIDMRKHVPMLKNLKTKLRQINDHPLNVQPAVHCAKVLDGKIQRVLNDTAGKIKTENQKGCQFIAAINDFITPTAN